MTADSTQRTGSRVQGDEYEKSPGKVPHDRDEAKALPDDVPVNTTGGPDADLHHPAMANAAVDTEAGSDTGSEGRIEPLLPKARGGGSGRG
jgi:hypothetical protein